MDGCGCSNRWEVSTVGLDPNLQTVGSPNTIQPYSVGLKIPANLPGPGISYLFTLAFARFGAHEKGCLVGIRQMLTMIAYVTGASEDEGDYPLEFEIKSPFWHFTDSVVEWSVRKVAPDPRPVFNNPANADGLMFEYAMGPALLYQTPPPAYTPPDGFSGNVLTADLASIRDIRFPWQDDHAWDSLSVPFEGPCDIVLQAKVLQTVPANRQTLATALNILPFITPEDAFIAENGPAPSAVLFRIAGSLIFQMENMQADPRRMIDPQPLHIETTP